MNNILVPIDFSKDSINALEHAITLANQLKISVRLIHVRKSKDYDKPFVIDGSDSVYGKTVEDFCQGIIASFSDKYKGGGKLDFVIKQGKIYKCVVDQALKDKSKLIMMGTHGISGFEEFWLGSNSYRVVSKAPCPVLTIRHGFRKESIKKIVLPIDAHRETRMKIPFTTEIAKAVNAEIHIIDVRSTNRADVIKRLKKYADQAYDYVIQHGVSAKKGSTNGNNIADITISYGVHVEADLIVIVSNQRGTPLNMNLSTTAQQMVNHSPLPVLSIHPGF